LESAAAMVFVFHDGNIHDKYATERALQTDLPLVSRMFSMRNFTFFMDL
jgi:hypothetical protein